MKITKSQLKQIIKEELEGSTWDNYEKIGVRSLPQEEKNALAAAAIDVVMRDPKFIKKATELARKYLWDRPTRTQTAAGAHGSGVESVRDFTRSQGQAKSFEDKNQQTGRLKVNPLPVYLIPLKDVVEGKLGWTEDFPTGRPGVWSPYKSVLYAPLVDAWLEKMRPSGYKELGDLGYLRKQIGSFNQETYKQIRQELSAKEYIPKLSALRDGLVGLEYDKNTNEELLKSLKRAYSALTKHVWPRSSPATRPRLGPSRPPGITSHLGGGMGGGMRFEGKMKITRRQLKQIIKEELGGGLVGTLSAARPAPDDVPDIFAQDDIPDTVVQDAAKEFFATLKITEEVLEILVNNIAVPDLKTLMEKVPKIHTAEEENPKG
jgi:hypothetical protein